MDTLFIGAMLGAAIFIGAVLLSCVVFGGCICLTSMPSAPPPAPRTEGGTDRTSYEFGREDMRAEIVAALEDANDLYAVSIAGNIPVRRA